jgi:DNA-binding CsgD family transcriptional regulator
LFGYTRVNFPHLNKWFQKILKENDIYNTPDRSHLYIRGSENIHGNTGEGTLQQITTRNKEEKSIDVERIMLKSGRILLIFIDKTDQTLIREELETRNSELNTKIAEIEEMDAAMRILLKSKEKDRSEIEENIMYNMKNLVMPYLEKLENSHLDAQQRFNLKMLKEDLQRVVSPFSRCLSLNQINLTPTEIQVANLIKEGKITKEIASSMNISASAVEFHRYNIRKKLNLVNRKVNLRSYLQSL